MVLYSYIGGYIHLKNIPRNCKVCKKAFYAWPADVKRGKAVCCSKLCASKTPKGGHRFKKGELRKPVSKETREKLSKACKGEKHYNWKGGISPLNAKLRSCVEYRLWRKSVVERDNYTCIWCGSKEKIQADHIKPFGLYPELRFAIDNGRTLCEECHKKTDSYAGKALKLKRE